MQFISKLHFDYQEILTKICIQCTTKTLIQSLLRRLSKLPYSKQAIAYIYIKRIYDWVLNVGLFFIFAFDVWIGFKFRSCFFIIYSFTWIWLSSIFHLYCKRETFFFMVLCISWESMWLLASCCAGWKMPVILVEKGISTLPKVRYMFIHANKL